MDWFKYIFDTVLCGLSIYLFNISFKMKKKKEIPEALLPANNSKIKDEEGFINMLYPSSIIFAILTLLFGVERFISDFGLLKKMGSIGNTIINVVFGVLFIISFGLFYSKLHEATSKFSGMK